VVYATPQFIPIHLCALSPALKELQIPQVLPWNHRVPQGHPRDTPRTHECYRRNHGCYWNAQGPTGATVEPQGPPGAPQGPTGATVEPRVLLESLEPHRNHRVPLA